MEQRKRRKRREEIPMLTRQLPTYLKYNLPFSTLSCLMFVRYRSASRTRSNILLLLDLGFPSISHFPSKSLGRGGKRGCLS